MDGFSAWLLDLLLICQLWVLLVAFVAGVSTLCGLGSLPLPRFVALVGGAGVFSGVVGLFWRFCT